MSSPFQKRPGEKLPPKGKGERVVFATICGKCGSLVGKEKVKVLSKTEIKKQLDSTNFFAYKDKANKSEFRSVSFENGCNQC